MGAVYVARHEATGARRALKVLPPGQDAEAQARFLREGEAMARVDGHPNVVRVFSAGADHGRLFLALELVEGGDLGSRLRRDGPRPPREAAELVRTLALALAHLHARGVLHRDLKPGNVLLAADGTPRVADFGLARLAGAQSLTRTGGLLGSPGYMAPEQVDDAKAVDVRCDVYGLGAVLYATLTGQPPFGADGRGVTYVLRQVLTQPPPRPSALVPGLPAALEGLCLRCLEKEPAARPPSARALADDLGAFLRGELAAPRGGRRALALVALAGVGAVALGGALLVRRGPDPGPGQVSAVATASDAARAAEEAEVRAEYLRLCGAALEAPSRLPERLTELAGRLEPAGLAALGPVKAAGVAALVSTDGPRLRAQLRPPGAAVETLRRLDQLLRAPPAVEAPAELVALLDEALTEVWLKRDARGDELTEVCAAELARARLVSHRRPPDALGTWLVDHLRGDSPLPLAQLRAALWADLDGVAGIDYLRPELRGFQPDELARARAFEPTSQALALLELSALVGLGESTKASDAVYDPTWAAALVAAREATSPRPPTDLGPRWVVRARWLTCKALLRVHRGFPQPLTPEARAAATELLELSSAARAGRPPDVWLLDDLAVGEAKARMALGLVAEARDGWLATLDEVRGTLEGEQRPQALVIFDRASAFFSDVAQDHATALAVALEAHGASRTAQQARRAATAALHAARGLPIDDERQARVDALLPDDPATWIVAWSVASGLEEDDIGTEAFAAELVMRRLRRDDRAGASELVRLAARREVAKAILREPHLPAELRAEAAPR